MEQKNDTDKFWKRPLGCLLWILVFFLFAPILSGLILVLLALFEPDLFL